MSEFTTVLSGGRAAPDDAPITTFAALLAALDAPPEPGPIEPFYHESGQLTFHIHKMSLRGFHKTSPDAYNIKVPPNVEVKELLKMGNFAEQNLINKTVAYIAHATTLQDGKSLEEKDARRIATRERWGVSNLALVATCERFNPRPGDPADLVTILLASQKWLALAIDALFEAGVLPAAFKEIGMTETEGEGILKYQHEFRAVLRVRQFAKSLDIPFEEALARRAAMIQEQMGQGVDSAN